MRCLIIDDDLVCRRILSRLLRVYGEVSCATDGAEGLAQSEEAISGGKPFQLICIDLMMPLLDGHDVLTALRQLEDQRHILTNQRAQVLVVTALDDRSSVLRSFREQCDGYLVKPVTAESLKGQLLKLGLVGLSHG
jgi:two-component system chemotaxis response regulator CheY